MIDFDLSEAALLHLITYALEGVEGVRLASGRSVGDVFSGRRARAVKVTRDEGGVRVELALVAVYGKPLPALGEEVQRAVSESLRATAGLRVKAVDVTFSEVEPRDAS